MKELSYDIDRTSTDQSAVIGIEEKEVKWHEKSGLASLHNNLIPFFSATQRFTTIIRHSHDSYATVI